MPGFSVCTIVTPLSPHFINVFIYVFVQDASGSDTDDENNQTVIEKKPQQNETKQEVEQMDNGCEEKKEEKTNGDIVPPVREQDSERYGVA